MGKTVTTPWPTLKPLAFPSDTDLRFALLIVSVLSVSLFTFSWIVNSLMFGSVFGDFSTCLGLPAAQRPGQTAFGPVDSLFVIQSRVRDEARLTELLSLVPDERLKLLRTRMLVPETRDYVRVKVCLQNTEVTISVLTLLGAAAVLGLAWLFYRAEPAKILKARHLESIPPEDAPDVLDRLNRLAGDLGLGLEHLPKFVWNPLDAGIGGLAFGYRGNYHMAITGGLATRLLAAPKEFDAVALHEMSHILHGDVFKTYFAVAIWRAFAIAGLIPFGLCLLWNLLANDGSGIAFDFTWRIAALTLVMLITRNSILRLRELYADAEVAQFGTIRPALLSTLSKLPEHTSNDLKQIIATHPTRGQRMRAVESQAYLFAMPSSTPFLAGVIGAIGFSALRDLLDQVLPLSLERISPVFASLVLASLAGATIGVGIWRAQLARLMIGSAHTNNSGRLGVALALGFLVGRWLSADSAMVQWTYSSTFPVLLSLGFVLVWLIILIVGLLLLANWTADAASRALIAARSLSAARRWLFACILLVGIAIAMIVGVAFAFDTPVVSALSAIFLIIMRASPLDSFTLAVGPALTTLTFAALWIFPLLARRYTRPWTSDQPGNTTGHLEWRYLPRPLRPWTAVIIGILSGVVFLFALPGLIILFGGSIELGRDYLLRRLLFSGALIQIIGVIVVLIRVRTAPLMHALLVATLAGCVNSAACMLALAPYGTPIESDLTFSWLIQSINTCSLVNCCVVAVITMFSFRTPGKLPEPAQATHQY